MNDENSTKQNEKKWPVISHPPYLKPFYPDKEYMPCAHGKATGTKQKLGKKRSSKNA